MRAIRTPLSLMLCALAVSAFSGAGLRAQDVERLVLDGDTIAGVGNVISIQNIVVNNDGDWIVEAKTDHINLNADTVLIKTNSPYLREGDPVPLPNGASIGDPLTDGFDSLTLNNHGNSAWNLDLEGTGSSFNDSGIYVNSILLLQEGDISNASAFSNNTPYLGFFETKYNDDGRILIVASVDDPAIPSTTDHAIIVLRLAGAQIDQEKVRYKEGDVLDGQTAAILDFETGPHQVAYNNFLDIITVVQLNAPADSDHAMYLNDQLLHQEGDPTGLGRNIEFLSSRPVHMNNLQEYVFRVNLVGDGASDEVIIKNGGTVIAQEGSTKPDIAPFDIVNFGSSAPVFISDAGDVVWYAEWDDPNTNRNSGIFVNDDLIVQEGVTQVNGLTLTYIESGINAFSVSESGQWMVFRGQLQGGLDGAFKVDLGSGGFRIFPPDPGEVGPNTMICTGAIPDFRVWFAGSLQLGSGAMPGCPPLGLGNYRIIGKRKAGPLGNTIIAFNIPGVVSGRTAHFQAVMPAACEFTTIVDHTFP